MRGLCCRPHSCLWGTQQHPSRGNKPHRRFHPREDPPSRTSALPPFFLNTDVSPQPLPCLGSEVFSFFSALMHLCAPTLAVETEFGGVRVCAGQGSLRKAGPAEEVHWGSLRGRGAAWGQEQRDVCTRHPPEQCTAAEKLTVPSRDPCHVRLPGSCSLWDGPPVWKGSILPPLEDTVWRCKRGWGDVKATSPLTLGEKVKGIPFWVENLASRDLGGSWR